MSDEIRVLSVIRAAAEMAEERACLSERVRRLEAVNVELQAEVEKWKAVAEGLRPKTKA